MTTSASTPRLRLTQTWYLVLLLLSVFCSRPLRSPWDELLLSSVSLLLVVGGILGRIWCSAFIAGRKDEVLVTTGPYSLVRHPLYSLSWIAGLGLGLATRSLVLTAITLVLLAILFWRAASAEERLLMNLHGSAFSDYAAVTPRFVPRRLTTALPANIQVLPDVFIKSFRDARAMLLLYLLICAACRAQQLGMLPTLARLP